MSVTTAAERNPFLRYRDRLDSYEAVRSGELSDQQFVDIVEGLDAAVAEIEGHGFVETPVLSGAPIAEAAGIEVDLWIKAEPTNVGGSHKARHLFGVALAMLVDEALGAPLVDRFAIASCGNAALGAGVVAAAMHRRLDVFVPEWADESVTARLEDLGAAVNRCSRRPDEAGDPAFLRFREATNSGATAFAVQGTESSQAFDGGRTLGWELADQLDDIAALYVQVGGGALGTSAGMALPDVKLFPVQTEGCAPLARAWDRLAPAFDFTAAALHPDDFMWPWEDEPTSAATGILDDVTYDWLPLLTLTRRSGGRPIVVPENEILRAHALSALVETPAPICVTGTSGLAGLLAAPETAPTSGKVVVLFTGVHRG